MLELGTVYTLHVQLAGGRTRMFTLLYVVFNL